MIRSHSGTLALKTEDFSKKESVVLVKCNGERGLLERGSFQKSPFSRDSREFRDSRDFRESPDSGK